MRAWRRGWLLLLAGCAVALQAAAPAGWPTTVDVDPGETVTAVRNGVPHTFRILNDAQGQPAITHETMPFPTISPDYRVNYAARVRLLVDGQEVEVVARPLQYPIDAAGLRLYLDGTQEWLDVGIYAVAIPKRIRLRFTAAGESWGPATLRFPVGDYRWYATTYNNTWLGIVPQGVETTYYHKGEDFGAVPERLPVFAPEAGTVTTSEWSVQFTAADGTITRMFHMNPPTIVVTAGQTLAAGQLLGLTGQYGNGNSDPHLHYDFRWDGDEPGTYPFAADAYLRDYPDAGIPVAGGYQFMFAGDTLTLDGRRSLARPGRTITGYRWILHDGTVVDGPTAALTPPEPGFYSQELRVFFDDGRQERGFTAVRVFARGAASQMPITGLVYEYPVRGITPGSQVTIGHYPFGEGGNERTIDFGDGSPVETVYGYQPTVAHAYAAPGLYTVTIRTVGGMKQILKTSVLVEPFGSGPNHAPVIAGPAARQWRCFAGAEFAVALAATDVDGDPLDWSVARPAVHGAAEVGPDGLVRYRPAAGFIGADTFAIKVDDGRSGFASVECSVVVAAVPIIGAGGARIEAEDYDEGAGVGYHDADARQGSATLRSGGSANEVDLVALAAGGDAPGWKVGYTTAGEWLHYTLTVPATGRYNLRLRVSNGSGGTSADAISLRWKGAVVAGPLTVLATGGWDTFIDLDVPGFVLTAGTNQLQVDCATGGFDLNWLELTPAGAAPYAAWIASYFPAGTTPQTDPAADPDGDGLNNFLEYGLGRAPNAAEPPLAPAVWTDPAAPVNQHLALTFKRAKGVNVVAEISDDLVTWGSAPANLVQVGTAALDLTGLYETVTFRSTATTTAKPRQFLRVRVTLP